MSKLQALNVLIIHGVGTGGNANYARPLEQNIAREFDAAIRALRLKDVDRKDARARFALRFRAANWSRVTQDPQSALLSVMGFARRWWNPFSNLNLTLRFRRSLVNLVGDMIAYEADPTNLVYQAIHKAVDDAVEKLRAASVHERDADDLCPLTIIGHSLGSVVGSDYVWDHTRDAARPYYLTGKNFYLANFVSMGSPLALYALRENAYGDANSIKNGLPAPIRVEPEHGLWLNLYDKQDAIAFPLEPIRSYAEANVVDRAVAAGNRLTGWTALSHTGYWGSTDAAHWIGRKLALDWARVHSPSFAERDHAKAADLLRRDLRRD